MLYVTPVLKDLILCSGLHGHCVQMVHKDKWSKTTHKIKTNLFLDSYNGTLRNIMRSLPSMSHSKQVNICKDEFWWSVLSGNKGRPSWVVQTYCPSTQKTNWVESQPMHSHFQASLCSIISSCCRKIKTDIIHVKNPKLRQMSVNIETL